ncbi:MAG: nucleotidyltransferase domain-containing protein [Chloroflexi bacterium]|nr:nucleotidyltransferase domain-containing protein [Chloroflexota bacterium]
MRKGSSSSVRVFYPEFDRKKVVELIAERLEELKARFPVVRVVLFGSYARGNYTVGSDIDLLVVYAGKPREDAYAVVKKTLGIPRLEPHLYTEGEYERMSETLSKMTRDGVVLFPRGGA